MVVITSDANRFFVEHLFTLITVFLGKIKGFSVVLLCVRLLVSILLVPLLLTSKFADEVLNLYSHKSAMQHSLHFGFLAVQI